ncbi:hypothetical protein NCTC2275_05043 [Mycobacterium marinum]|nr:hypothetical protein NCTC2275_05043 [Mycobacterium marinum]
MAVSAGPAGLGRLRRSRSAFPPGAAVRVELAAPAAYCSETVAPAAPAAPAAMAAAPAGQVVPPVAGC